MRNQLRWALILSLVQVLSLASAQDGVSRQGNRPDITFSTQAGGRPSVCQRPRERARRAKKGVQDAKQEAKGTLQKILDWFRNLFDRVGQQLKKIWQSMKSKGGGKGGGDDDYLEE